MVTIAFDTCFGACSAAVFTAEHVLLAHRFEERQTGHAEALIPMLRDAMAEARAHFSDLSRIFVTIGPGSFTGVRIGVSVAKSLALVTKAEIVATSSLHLMAAGSVDEFAAASPSNSGLPDSILLVAVDARREQLHVQAFTAAGVPLGAPLLLSAESAAALLPGRDMIVVGSGGKLLAYAARKSGRAIEPRLPRLQPDARFLAQATASRGHADASAPVSLRPLYMRPPDAKPQSGKSLPHAK